jgi:flavodoxin
MTEHRKHYKKTNREEFRMKKFLTILLALLLLTALAACSETPPPTAPPDAGPAENSAAQNKILVAYYSHTGNTKAVAGNIGELTGGDLFEIVPQTPYPSDDDELYDIALRELDEDARPAIAGTVEEFSGYEIIFIGYPNWCDSMPMIIRTFLDGYDFAGKTVVPFCTYGGSGFGDSLSVMERMAGGAAFLEGLQIQEDDVNNSRGAVEAWLDKIGVGS